MYALFIALLCALVLHICAASMQTPAPVEELAPHRCPFSIYCPLCAFALLTDDPSWTNLSTFNEEKVLSKLLRQATMFPARGFATVILKKFPDLSSTSFPTTSSDHFFNRTKLWLRLYEILLKNPETELHLPAVMKIAREYAGFWRKIEMLLWFLEYPDNTIKSVLLNHTFKNNPGAISSLLNYQCVPLTKLVVEALDTFVDNPNTAPKNIFNVVYACVKKIGLLRVPKEAVVEAIRMGCTEGAIRMLTEDVNLEFLSMIDDIEKQAIYKINGELATFDEAQRWLDEHGETASMDRLDLFGTKRYTDENTVLVKSTDFKILLFNWIKRSHFITNAKLVMSLIEGAFNVEETEIVLNILDSLSCDKTEAFLLNLMKDLQFNSNLASVGFQANPSAVVLAAIKLRFNILFNSSVPNTIQYTLLATITEQWIKPAWTQERMLSIVNGLIASNLRAVLFVYLVEYFIINNDNLCIKEAELREIFNNFKFELTWNPDKFKKHITRLCSTLYPLRHNKNRCMCKITAEIESMATTAS